LQKSQSNLSLSYYDDELETLRNKKGSAQDFYFNAEDFEFAAIS
jgi:hypothetical protein